jgi:hypothetical protein
MRESNSRQLSPLFPAREKSAENIVFVEDHVNEIADKIMSSPDWEHAADWFNQAKTIAVRDYSYDEPVAEALADAVLVAIVKMDTKDILDKRRENIRDIESKMPPRIH